MRVYIDNLACQDGNGGLAMASGRHSAQANLSGGALFNSINEARLQHNLGVDPTDFAPDIKPPVLDVINSSVGRILVSDTGPGDFGGLKSYEFKVGDRRVDVMIEYDKGASPIKNGDKVSIDFAVNGGFNTSGRNSRGSAEIANGVSQVFRQEVKDRPEGTLFRASAAVGDRRGQFREAMYARAGLSFGGSSVSPTARSAGDSQFGVKVDGKLVPSDRSRIFTAEEQQTHKAAVRSALREGIRAARGNRDRRAG